MISFTTFLRALKESVNREPNKGQREAVEAVSGASLFVVAGPGTGKTATLTMRMLKLIFVDGISPRGILATTFTNKAAQELRSRLLSWGYAVQEHLQKKEKLSKLAQMWLDRIDINQVRTGTIDSICEELLRDFRDPGTDPPVLADQFVSETLLLRAGLFNASRYEDDDLTLLLATIQGKVKKDGTAYANFSVPEKLKILSNIADRRLHDQLDSSAADCNTVTLASAICRPRIQCSCGSVSSSMRRSKSAIARSRRGKRSSRLGHRLNWTKS
jgi:DNA helicase-2/ATP-dependent DNA helicase PcrA